MLTRLVLVMVVICAGGVVAADPPIFSSLDRTAGTTGAGADLEDPPIAGGAVWFRGGASYRFRHGPLGLQLDYLTDVPAGLDLDSSELQPTDGFPVRVTVAGGAAYAPGSWSVAGEVVASGHPYVDLPDNCYAVHEVFEATRPRRVRPRARHDGVNLSGGRAGGGGWR